MSGSDDAWSVVTHRASAADLHARTVPESTGRQVWVLEPTGPAVVLGSTQPADDVDAAAAATAGVDVVRRRSGGGAVWVAPDDPVWIDVIIPRHDPAWSDDVGASFAPVGRAWRAALVGLGVRIGEHGAASGRPEDLEVHTGAMAHGAWSRTVCFAGLGPGEVVVARPESPTGVAKVVGIAQRRTRHGARFQCAIPRRWDPEPLRALLRDAPPAGVLDPVGAGIGGVAVDDLVAGFIAAFD